MRAFLFTVQLGDFNAALNEVEVMCKCVKHKRRSPQASPSLLVVNVTVQGE